MAKDTVTNQQLYTAILDVHKKIDAVVEERIRPLEVWKATIMGQLAIVGSIFLIVINLVVDWVKEKIFKI